MHEAKESRCKTCREGERRGEQATLSTQEVHEVEKKPINPVFFPLFGRGWRGEGRHPLPLRARQDEDGNGERESGGQGGVCAGSLSSLFVVACTSLIYDLSNCRSLISITGCDRVSNEESNSNRNT